MEVPVIFESIGGNFSYFVGGTFYFYCSWNGDTGFYFISNKGNCLAGRTAACNFVYVSSFLSVIFVPTETDGVGVTVGAEVIAGVGVAVGTGVTVGIGSLAIVSVLVTPQTVQVYVFTPSSAIVAGLVITPLFQVCLPEAGISVISFLLSQRVQ